jgi:predicted amino acid-binding ACT domain protein
MLRIQRGLKQAPETGTLRIVNDPSAPGKQHLAVSAIGSDHTGMVHDLTRVITDCGGNIAESRMAALGNEFAMQLLVTGNWHTLARIESELGRLADTASLSVHLRRTEARAGAQGAGALLDRHRQHRPGRHRRRPVGLLRRPQHRHLRSRHAQLPGRAHRRARCSRSR